MRILLLSHDLELAKNWINKQDIQDLYIIDERSVAEQNPPKFSRGFLNYDYSKNMVEFMRILEMTYKSSRPVCYLMDMRHQTAVEKISHDISVLFYDNSKKRKLNYNTFYKTDYFISDFNQKLLLDLLQKTG